MHQTPETEAFISRIVSLPKGPNISLDEALQPALDDEAELRRLFATDKTNARLKDPYVGLIDVFTAPANIRTTRARVVKDDHDLSAKYIMPLCEADRRKEGAPSMAPDLDEFKKNWAIFTEGSLSQLLDWNNVIAAGGAVLGAMSPLPDAAKESKRSIRKHYHSVAYPTSDVDLFLWGLDPEQAENKISAIYEAVRDSVPWDVTCVRTKHAVSIHSQYPYRSVQIVLRLYSSPAEILAGFDIDAPCFLYNGQRVFANPRAIVAMMRQCNTVDMTRRSPSYEVRLTKYSSRGFEVYVPTLKREHIDPTIYERSIARIAGLARLLALEKLADTNARDAFLQSRKKLRGRPVAFHRYNSRKRKYKGDLKADMSVGGLEMNNYDVASLHVPYGPGWNARRINKLVYQTDLGMNSTFNPKNKGRRLHRHPAFFGTMKECMEDCCEHCPKPIDADELALQTDEDNHYIRGRISFIKEDPGRQSISGSFHPIDVGEWSEQVYIGETEHLFAAVVAFDRERVSKMIASDSVDINRRDHVGRTALHVAILSKSTDIACDLIEAGARISARLLDGRNALHLAAQLDQPTVVQKLLERSMINREQSDDATTLDTEDPQKAIERPSSEDDWSSEDGGVVALDTADDEGDEEAEKGPSRQATMSSASDDAEVFPEDQTNAPDLLDVNLPAWDHGFTPLAYAVLFASRPMVEKLLTAGADPHLLNTTRDRASHLLTLLILRDDEDEASEVLQALVLAGASTSTADDQMQTIFHRAVMADKLKLVSSILRYDPNAKAVLDFPTFIPYGGVVLPLVSAIAQSKYAMVALMLAYGVKLTFTEEDITTALTTGPLSIRRNYMNYSSSPVHRTYFPLEVAIARHDDLAHLLIDLGAEINFGISLSTQYRHTDASCRRSLMEGVQFVIASILQKVKARTVALPQPALSSSWKQFYTDLVGVSMTPGRESELKKYDNILNYLRDIEGVLAAHSARSWNSIYPDKLSTAHSTPVDVHINSSGSYQLIPQYGTEVVPGHLNAAYDELYEACYSGDNKKVQQLCLPQGGSDPSGSPLNIYVQTIDPTNEYNNTGVTPLYAAIRGRRWDTARLVLAIATAQYHPNDQEKKFTADGIHLDDLSDDESDDSGDSDETIDEEPIIFVDIAKKPSIVQTNVHPKKLLDELSFNLNDKGSKLPRYGNHLAKAVADGDLKSFVNILGLYKSSPIPITIGPNSLDFVVAADRPDMLDECIRSTGCGIDVKNIQESGAVATNDKDKLYLGLHVHGKKRMDLAQKAGRKAATIPLLWNACLAGAKDVVEYLAGDRPLAAYRFYASTSNEEFAVQLRRTANLEKILPQWLGWVMTPLDESPLTAGVLGKNLDLVRTLFAKKPKMMGSSIHSCINFTGYNLLLLAADCGCSTALVDFLLAKSVSPVETDQIRGWNIYHILCAKNHSDLLEHLLQKLPRDVSEALLAQQSKGRSNTPLHLAVKTGAIRATQLIVNFSRVFAGTTLSLRDIDGCTPLHSAVHAGFAEITEVLANALPQISLHMENGVGETPLEIASVTLMLERIQCFIPRHISDRIPSLAMNATTDPPRVDIKQLEGELPRLRTTIQHLAKEGLLTMGNKITVELEKFADMMDTKLAEAKAAEAAKSIAEENNHKHGSVIWPLDVVARARTLDVVSKHVSVELGQRQLVRLLDVQRSVQGNLSRYADDHKDKPNNEGEWGSEENVDRKEGQGSLLSKYCRVRPDAY